MYQIHLNIDLRTNESPFTRVRHRTISTLESTLLHVDHIVSVEEA